MYLTPGGVQPVSKEATNPGITIIAVGCLARQLAVAGLSTRQDHAMSHHRAPFLHHPVRYIGVKLYAIGVAGAKSLIVEIFAGGQMLNASVA